MKQVKYLTVFLGSEEMALAAREAVDGQLANGWEIVQTLNLGMGNAALDNRPQIQILHILMRDVPEEKASIGRPKKDA
jgi:hypothetical protein